MKKEDVIKKIVDSISAHYSMSDNKEFDEGYNKAIKELSVIAHAYLETTLAPSKEKQAYLEMNDLYDNKFDRVVLWETLINLTQDKISIGVAHELILKQFHEEK